MHCRTFYLKLYLRAVSLCTKCTSSISQATSIHLGSDLYAEICGWLRCRDLFCFLNWCNNSFLEIDVLKTKDMHRHLAPPFFHSAPSLRVKKWNLSSAIPFCSIISFECNTEMVCTRGQRRLFCLRKLCNFPVDRSLMILLQILHRI